MYEDMIVNMWKGHSFLQKEFGYRPRVGWMLDAFGQSEANAALFADFGFDYYLFTRIRRADRIKMRKDKSLHFMWKPFSKNSNHHKRNLLTQITSDKYKPLPGL
jgi:alpha-mannosidase